MGSAVGGRSKVGFLELVMRMSEPRIREALRDGGTFGGIVLLEGFHQVMGLH